MYVTVPLLSATHLLLPSVIFVRHSSPPSTTPPLVSFLLALHFRGRRGFSSALAPALSLAHSPHPPSHLLSLASAPSSLSGCEYFNWLDHEMTGRATIVINRLLRKLDRIESEKRLEDEFKGRRKLNGCSVACRLCLVVIVLLFGTSYWS
ncbi:hypothetical protein Syun_023401 [Stephania yunnanensis]|uniref:Uncharacterized protein n=1 Tax=Stephania yunnanensis TaxID=152371 RepID=A0AAP0FBQ6_9MAGN